MPDDPDVRLTLARLEGMLQATLPQHAARLDEHDRVIATLSSTQVAHGERIAGIEATDRHRVPGWTIVSSVAAAGSLLLAVLVLIVTR